MILRNSIMFHSRRNCKYKCKLYIIFKSQTDNYKVISTTILVHSISQRTNQYTSIFTSKKYLFLHTPYMRKIPLIKNILRFLVHASPVLHTTCTQVRWSYSMTRPLGHQKGFKRLKYPPATQHFVEQ